MLIKGGRSLLKYQIRNCDQARQPWPATFNT